MSEEKINSEDVFEREMRLCEDFRYHKSTDDVIIYFNISSEMMTIWVYYNNWNSERRTKILNALLTWRKLNLVGYHPWQIKTYPAAEWEEREKTCQYTSHCLNFNFDLHFCDVNYRTYDDSYGDFDF